MRPLLLSQIRTVQMTKLTEVDARRGMHGRAARRKNRTTKIRSAENVENRGAFLCRLFGCDRVLDSVDLDLNVLLGVSWAANAAKRASGIVETVLSGQPAWRLGHEPGVDHEPAMTDTSSAPEVSQECVRVRAHQSGTAKRTTSCAWYASLSIRVANCLEMTAPTIPPRPWKIWKDETNGARRCEGAVSEIQRTTRLTASTKAHWSAKE